MNINKTIILLGESKKELINRAEGLTRSAALKTDMEKFLSLDANDSSAVLMVKDFDGSSEQTNKMQAKLKHDLPNVSLILICKKGTTISHIRDSPRYCIVDLTK